MSNQLHIVLAIAFSLLLLASSLEPILAQGDHCDPGLPQRVSDSYGYRLRGDRCEGIYIREVQGSAIKVVSLTESVEDFSTATNKNLLMTWVAPSRISVRLRAYGLRHKLYYRMDSLRPAGTTSYDWSPNLLAALNLRRHELGLVAWVSQPVDNKNRDVYLPVSLTQQTASKSDHYDLVLLPGVELTELFLSVAPLKPDGAPDVYIRQNESLGRGYYPAERKITIPLPKPRTSGIYYVEIGGTKKAGGSLTMQAWFYHH